MLKKAPAERGSLRDLLSALDDLGKARKADELNAAQIRDLEQQLLQAPDNSEIAMALEAAIGRGATLEQVGQSFRLAASMMDDPVQYDDKRALLIRAAR